MAGNRASRRFSNDGDQHARRVLAAISREPQSATELAEECDLSSPTVYRRIELLDEYDLITDRTLVAEDGNHYKVYESNFESTVVSLEDEETTVTVKLGNLGGASGNISGDVTRNGTTVGNVSTARVRRAAHVVCSS